MSDDDRELRKLFAQLKAEDRARISAFRVPAVKAAAPWSPVARVALAAAIVLIAVVLARPDQTPRNMAGQVVDLGATTWQSSTDFLLITPGSELLRSVPAVGSPEDWAPIDVPGRVPEPESTRATRSPS